MRCVFAFALLCGFFTLAGCGDDNGTSPAGHSDLLAETVIGGDGGTLATEDFLLDVPAGAFAAETLLSLHEDQGEGLAYDSATTIYRLEGLPGEINQPLGIELAFTSAPVSDTLIVAAIQLPHPGDDDTYVLDMYLDATIDGDRLIGTWLPPSDEDRIAKVGPRHAFLFGPRDLQTKWFPNHAEAVFAIRSPLVGRALVDDLGAALMYAHSVYAELGFESTIASPPVRPIPVVNIKFEDTPPPAGQYVSSAALSTIDSEDYAGMRLYLDRMNPGDLGELFIAVSGQLAGIIHLAQTQHNQWNDPRYWEHAWLRSAVTLWAEDLFATEPDRIPSAYDPDGWRILNGLLTHIFDSDGGQNAQSRFGRAVTPLLKYLIDVEDSGANLLVRTYAATRADIPTGEAFLAAIAGSSSQWWPGFLRALLTGEIYDLPADTFLGQSSSTTVNQQTWELTLSPIAMDLSATDFRINPVYAGWGNGASLDIAVSSPGLNDDYVKALVFSLKNGEATFLASGRDIRIENLAAFRDDGAELLILLANAAWDIPAIGPTPLTLEMSIDEDTTSIDSSMYVALTIEGQFAGEASPRNYSFNTPNPMMSGTFDGSTFTGWYENTAGEIMRTCSMICQLDLEANPPRILTWSFVQDVVNSSSLQSQHFEAAGTEVPHYVSGTGSEQWYVTGTDACLAIDSVVLFTMVNGVVTEELIDFGCNANSRVRIDFYPWVRR